MTIDIYSNNKRFELKLADRLDKDGKVIPGRVESFDDGASMSNFFETQTPVKRRRKRSKANIEGRKKKAALHKQNRETQR